MIKKEITLRADTKEVWNYITSQAHFKNLWNSRVNCDLKKGGEIKLLDTGESVKITAIQEPKLLSLVGGYGIASISTTYSLSEKRSSTVLKISVGGWDKLDHGEIRKMVPAISLDWEKRLKQIKRAIETGNPVAP